ncbi:MAG: hypothetical protein KDK78_02630 [Chlamydiia bacterium]|nr:hypothetical protein [Chlamydiia bacterium]
MDNYFRRPQVLFIPYDAGEALAFEPVLDHLDEEGISYCILALGTARSMYQTHPQYLGLRADIGLKADIGPMNWRREMALPRGDVDEVLRAVKPVVVVSGMVSEVQRQLAAGFRLKGSRVVGYFDAMHALRSEAVEATFLDIVDEVWAPAERVAEGIRAAAPSLPIHVVGQPSLEAWMGAADTAEVNAWFEEAGLTGKRVLYCSGYGEDFVPSFELFVKTTQAFPHVSFAVSLHPRVPGTLEQRVLDDYPSDNIQIAPRHLPSSLLAHAVDAVVCYRSTAGFQALFLGKPVIYALSGLIPFSNLTIDLGIVPKVSAESELQKALQEALNTTCSVSVQELCQRLGIPPQASQLFADRIAALLS